MYLYVVTVGEVSQATLRLALGSPSFMTKDTMDTTTTGPAAEHAVDMHA